MNREYIKEMLDKKVWAVIGATPNTEKTANHILHMLIDHGYEVYAVNPNYEEIEPGIKCYKSILDLPVVPECIDFVIPPKVSLENLKALDSAKTPYVWLQPGTFDDEVVAYAAAHGFKAIHGGPCVMVELRLG
jgi:uncharacterized protein